MGKTTVKNSDAYDDSRLIVALDIGTSKVTAMVGLLPSVPGEKIEVIAIGSSPSKGMARGGRMAMKSKGYAKGGAVGGKKGKAMTVAQIRAAAKKKGYKLVKA